jgi:hypothetical protein
MYEVHIPSQWLHKSELIPESTLKCKSKVSTICLENETQSTIHSTECEPVKSSEYALSR